MSTLYRAKALSMDAPIATATVKGVRINIYPSLEFVRSFNALLQRTGGEVSDFVETALTAAASAKASAATAAVAAVAAYDAGAPAGYALAPTNPISVAAIQSTLARVSIATHTRTPTGMSPIALDSGAVDVSRGVNHHIYYNDPTDAGGAVIYLATTDATIASDYGAGNRIVGSAYFPPYVPAAGLPEGANEP